MFTTPYKQESENIMLPVLRHADNYRINFSNKLSFEEINESNALHIPEITVGWICLSIAKHLDGNRYSGIPNFFTSGIDLFTEVVKEEDGTITANPFLLSNEVLENIEVGYSVAFKEKSFPKNHLSDDSYSRLNYGTKVNMPLSGDDEMIEILQPNNSQNFDHHSISQYTVEEAYENFIQRVSTMKLFNTHWDSLAVSTKNVLLAGEFTKKYLDKMNYSNTVRKIRIRDYQNHVFKLISERHVFDIESNHHDSLKNMSLSNFKLLFINEVEVSKILREKYFPLISENSDKKATLLEEVSKFEKSI